MNSIDPKNRERLNAEKRKREYQKKRLKLLTVATFLLLLICIIVGFAAIRQGGFTNLISGNGDPISNALKNIGTSYSPNFTTTPTQNNSSLPTGTIVIPTKSDDYDKETLSNNQNFMAFYADKSSYNIKIKKNTFVEFRNFVGEILYIKFSGGRTLRLDDFGRENMVFTKTGKITFTEAVEGNPRKIKGTIDVQ